VKLEEIKEIINLLEKSSLNKLSLKKGDFELAIEKPIYPASPLLPLELKEVEKSLSTKPLEQTNEIFVSSPMVGTFYSTPSPNDPAFVKIGDIVDTNTVICIIEAMKVMNEVKAGMKGKIKEILCKSAQPVEFGTKLFRIEPL
jgi:acetyl-CoA carboxylase biotin carboxyl carrier protein